MKILLISHTSLSKTGNMGKTLRSYVSAFSPGEVAQFYIHSELPTDKTICINYYRFTDVDVIKSLFNPFHKGVIFNEDDIKTNTFFARTDEGLINSAYLLGSKRNAWSMISRELIWKISFFWKNDFKKWIDKFHPDIILFASGDYSFMYDIAYMVAEYCNKPLVTICVDDYYINQRNKTLLGYIHHKFFMKSVKRTIGRSCYIFTLSDAMNRAYEKLFHKKCFTVHNSVPLKDNVLNSTRYQMSYIGNLGLGRADQLVAIGKALSELNRKDEPMAIDVYTGSINPLYLDKLKNVKGIRLHGRITPDDVLKIMQKSIAIIHTESFDKRIQNIVRYSVSTKIAESLMYGPCLFVYGPEGVASIDYLKENNAAFVINNPKELCRGLQELINNNDCRKKIELHARVLARRNHDASVIPKKIRYWLSIATMDNNKIEHN